MARIQTVFADKGYDAEHHRDLCRKFDAEPCIHKRGQPHGSGLGKRRWPVERSNAWVLENKRLALRYDRLGFIIQSLLQAACIFLVAGRVPKNLKKPPLRKSSGQSSNSTFTRPRPRRPSSAPMISSVRLTV